MTLRAEVRAITRLAWPVVLSQLGLMTYALVDMAMIGRLGESEMAGVALADTWLFGTMILGLGLIAGIDPMVSQSHGAGRGADAGRALQQGIVLAVLASVPLMFAWANVGRVLLLLGQRPELAALGQAYAAPQVWSIAPALMFNALRSYLQGRGIMLPPLFVILGTNFLNILLNWVLIFGHFGAPAMGVAGAGLATAISRTAMPIALALVVFRLGLHRGAWTPWSRASFAVRRPASIGMHLALQLALEVWAFNLCTIIAGLLGAATAAAHAVVLKVASFSFMVPLGISAAAATRVGNRIGAGDLKGAQHSAHVALGVGAAVMGLSALAFLLLPGPLAAIFTPERGVITIAVTIFPVAAAFQIFDGTQAVGSGVLRGMGTPRPAAIFNLVGYYVLALPLGWVLAFPMGLGIRGIWIGLAAGLAAVAALLVLWIRYRGPARGCAASASAISAVE